MTSYIKNRYAPIVLLAFNRPEHFGKTIAALAQNEGAKESILFCFIDGPKNDEDIKKQKLISETLSDYKKDFRDVVVTKRKNNLGLAKNIVESVTEVVTEYGRVIVLEDDILTSTAFLKFMNDALAFYEKEDRVWHISAHSEANCEQRPDEVFLWRVMDCWGWATWNNKWEHFHKDAHLLLKEFDDHMIKEFDLDGTGAFWNQVLDNLQGRIDTWAIFWYATIFQNGGLCVNPYFSYSANIGFDGTGINCGIDDIRQKTQPLNYIGKFIGEANIAENYQALSIMRQAYLPNKNFRYYLRKLLTIIRSSRKK